MRNKAWSLIAVIGILSYLTACDLVLPTKVRIKASPTVNAALGNKEFKITDYFSIQDVKKALGNEDKMKVYDYIDSEPTQKFLIHLPITEVPLDFGEYLSTNFNQNIDPVEFEVPTIDFSSTISTDIPIGEFVRDSIGNIVVLPIPVVEPGSTPIPNETLESSLTILGFTSATFSSGSLELYMRVPDATPGFSLTMENITFEKDSSVLVSVSPHVDITSGRTISIPLTGVTLHSTMQIVVTVSTSGGSAGTFRNIVTTASLNNIHISGATGINFTENVPISSTIPLQTQDNFVEATISEGSMQVEIATLLDNFSGFTKTTSFTIQQEGGLDISNPATPNSTISISLTGQKVNSKDVSVLGTITITATNASFSGLESDTIPVTTSVSSTIGKFATLVIRAPADLVQTKDYSKPVEQDIKDWVRSIDFKEIGIKLTISNTLPSGNDLNIKVVSNAFGIGKEVVYLAGSSKTEGSFTNTNYTFVPAAHDTMDFTVTITPQGYDPGTGNLTLSNISPGGDPITFSGNIQTVADWEQATIMPRGDAYTGSFPETGQDPIDLSALADYLKGFEFDPIYVYLYLSSGVDITMTGRIWATYTGSQETLFEGSTTTIESSPVFPLGDTYTVAPDGTGALPDPSTGETPIDISEIINVKPADLRLNYTLTPNETVVTKPEKGTSFSPLKVEIAIIVPLKLNVAAGEDAEITYTDLKDKGEDLFGREAGANNETIDKVLESLETITLSVQYTNTTGLAGSIFLRQGSWESDTASLELTKDEEIKTLTFTLSRDDIMFAKNTIPFAPEFVIRIPEQGISINRGSMLDLSLKITATTAIDQTFDLQGEN